MVMVLSLKSKTIKKVCLFVWFFHTGWIIKFKLQIDVEF